MRLDKPLASYKDPNPPSCESSREKDSKPPTQARPQIPLETLSKIATSRVPLVTK